MVFAAEFATIGRVTARMLATGRCRYASGINASSIPHDLVVLAEQDPSQARAIIDTWPTALGRSSVGREMGCNERPKVFGKKCLVHGITPSANTAAILLLGLSPCTSAIAP